jgi:RHS repeat-associated protein
LGTIEYAYDAAGQLTAAGDTTFVYDALGRRTGKTGARGATTYTYGRDNRLTGINLPWGEGWRYGYDYAGRRVSEQGPAGTRRFAFDGWLLIAEQGADGRWEATYAYGPTGLAMRHRPDVAPALANTTYHSDGLGNITALTGAGGAPRDAYRHDPFGVSGFSTGLDPNPYRFAGAWGARAESTGTGLYLMGNRVYDSATGQFMTRDPLSGMLFDPLGQNAYGYARGNPLRYLDPLGLQSDITFHDDGSVRFTVGSQEVTIPSSAMDQRNQSIQTTGSYG